jgi:hypothetical protein
MLRRNVLIFHQGALGDFVLTWPFAIALGRIYPQSRIIYITHGQKGALAEKALRLESSDVEAGWHALFTDAAKLPPRAANLLTGTHAIYSFLSPTPTWTRNVQEVASQPPTPGSEVRRRPGSAAEESGSSAYLRTRRGRQQEVPKPRLVMLDPRPPESFTGHAAEWIAEQLREHPVEQAATQQILRSVADRGIGFNRPGGTDVVIHPGSGSPSKCWPIENFIRLAERFTQTGRKVRILLGEVEQERWPQKDIEAISAIAEPRRPQTYLELLAELSTAGIFIGNDSGPAHLAGIIGTPTISLFGPTNPARWKPLGPKVRVVCGGSLESISVEEVFGAA